MNIETLLEGEIQSEFEKLKELEVGTDDYKTTVDGLTKLVDRKIELEKLEADTQCKLKQGRDEKVGRWISNGIAVLGIAIPSIITVWGTNKSLKFEEEGTVTTIMGRGFINKLLPKK